jgi:hypothetical protein
MAALNRYQKLCFEQALGERERMSGVNGTRYEPLNGDGIIEGIGDINFEI